METFERGSLSKPECEQAIAMHTIAEGFSIDEENTRVLQIIKYIEALVVSIYFTCLSREVGENIGDRESPNIIEKQMFQRSSC